MQSLWWTKVARHRAANVRGVRVDKGLIDDLRLGLDQPVHTLRAGRSRERALEVEVPRGL